MVDVFLARIVPGSPSIRVGMPSLQRLVAEQAVHTGKTTSDGTPLARELTISAALHWDEAVACLDPVETARSLRFHDPEMAQAYVYAHALTRVLLRERLGPGPKIALTRGPRGKPRLSAPAGLHFNLSYRRGFAAIALGDAPLGIDVELIREGIDMPGIASRYFTPEERLRLESAPPQEKSSVFFRLWTLKEALVKAAGVGIDFLDQANTLTSPAPLVDEFGQSRLYGLFSLSSHATCALGLAVQLPEAGVTPASRTRR